MELTTAESLKAHWQAVAAKLVAGQTIEYQGITYTPADTDTVAEKAEYLSALITAKKQLAAWEEASLKVATMQSYAIDTPNGRRVVTRADAGEILAQINYWRRRSAQLETTLNGQATGALNYATAVFR